MKKLTAILLALLLSVGLSHAQITEVGPLGGGNVASIKGDTGELAGPQGSSETGNRFGGRIGGFLRFSVSESFTVRTELTYSQKGGTFETTSLLHLGPDTDARLKIDPTLRYDYLDLPVLAEYTFQTSSRFEPHLFAGPSIGFSVSAETETEVTITIFDPRSGNEQEIDPEDLGINEGGTQDADIETTDFGAVIGGGVSYAIKSGESVFLDVRYNPSLTAFNTDSSDLNIDLENQVITVGVGYSFSLR